MIIIYNYCIITRKCQSSPACPQLVLKFSYLLLYGQTISNCSTEFIQIMEMLLATKSKWRNGVFHSRKYQDG